MIKLLSLFSCIGAFEKALTNIGEPYQLINYCEIDKYASKAYSLIHNLDENMNLKDVTTIETAKLPHDIDFITYGFPCQDISQAGKQKGFTNENGDLTRSGLFFEALRIIEDTQPKIAIAENVKALTGKRFTAEFKIVLDSLNDAGYTNYWAVLNAKDYGIPQNRERVFIISIRNDINHGFNFPKKYELKLRLKDLLETDVDEKYYLSDEVVKKLIEHKDRNKSNGNGFGARFIDENDVAFSVTTNPTHSNSNSNSNSNFIKIKNATKKGYQEAHAGDYVNLQYPDSETRRGRVGEGMAQTLCCTDQNGVVVDKSESDKIITVGNYSPSNHNAARIVSQNGIAPTVMENHGTVTAVVVDENKQLKFEFTESEPAVVDRLFNIYGDDKGQSFAGNVYNPDGIAPTLNTMQGGNRQPLICCAASRGRGENNEQQLELRPDDCTNALTTVQKDNYIVETVIVKNQAREIKKQTDVAGCLMARDYKEFGNQEMNAVIEYEPVAYDEQNKYIRKDGCVGTLMTDGSSPKHNNRVITSDLRFRKLTPKECFRLMGFSDCDIDILIDNGISNTQLYKMAGNSIVVDVLEEIFVELLNQYENVFPVGG